MVNRLNTTAFIAANPILVTLIPRSRQMSGTGMKWIQQDPRPLQVGRLIEAGGTVQQAQDGIQRIDSFQLLLPFNGEVALDDFWHDAPGVRYEVTGILPYNGYERRAEVTRYGTEGQPVL